MGLAGPAPAWLAVHGSLQHPAGAGLAGRPEQAGAAGGPRTLWAEEAAARGVRGRPGTLGGRGLGLGPLPARPAGSWEPETAAWVGRRPLEPGRREAAEAWAWLPGRKAGKEGTRRPG